MAQKYFYGIQATYGLTMQDGHGLIIGTVNAFLTVRQRNSWVDQGNPYLNDPGSRTGLENRSLEVREAKKNKSIVYHFEHQIPKRKTFVSIVAIKGPDLPVEFFQFKSQRNAKKFATDMRLKGFETIISVETKQPNTLE